MTVLEFHNLLNKWDRFMADTNASLDTLRAAQAKLTEDLTAIAGSVTGLVGQVKTLTEQLAAAQAAGFNVPQDVLDAANAEVASADAILAALNAPSEVTVTDGGESS